MGRRRKTKPRGARSGATASASYHDRVAGRYDQIYTGRYWEVYGRLSWDGLKAHIPRDLSVPVVDLGCGTGLYGLRLLKSGFRVDFVDISTGMLERARAKAEELPGGAATRARFIRSDIGDLEELESGTYGLAVAQGDPICHAGARAEQALRACGRVLQSGGVLVASVDNALAAIDHFLDGGDPLGLEAFLRTGMTEWLTRDQAERFAVRMFRPDELAKVCERAGLELIDLFGKPVLPLRAHQALLDDEASRRALLRLERRLCREPALLGRAAHLQIAARRLG